MTPPIRPKAPAVVSNAGATGIRPRAPSHHDYPEARRAREPLPDEATVPMRRSDQPPAMPAEEDWSAGGAEVVREAAPAREVASPKPAAVAAPTSVVTDANVLREALQDALEPMQRAIDDLTVKLARERVDRKEAVERLERSLARVSPGNSPQTAFAAAVASSAAQPVAVPPARLPPVAPVPAAVAPPAAPNPIPAPVAQPFSVSPSAAPPPVVPVAAPIAAAAPADAASPAPPKAASPAPPVVSNPASIVVTTASMAPVKFDLDPYSTDLSFELPPGLDGSRRKKILGWFVVVIVVGGAIAMLVSMLYSRSRGPGAL